MLGGMKRIQIHTLHLLNISYIFHKIDMESSYFEIWLEVKSKQFINSTIFSTDSSLEEDIMLFLDADPGLTEIFSRELKFSNVFEELKKKITEKIS